MNQHRNKENKRDGYQQETQEEYEEICVTSDTFKERIDKGLGKVS